MFWIPYASIFIFVVTLVVSTILGYKRGWRSALFISILFLALNVAILGIEFAIYKSVLWDLYKSIFMKNETGINGIDYEVLAPHYRVRAMLVFAGLISPITYAITIGIYLLLKKPLNNYLMPRVKEISANEKELVYRKNPTPARIAGAAISGTTAIFAASFFASAANVVATPVENQNGFNKFNDVLGRIYNFGMAGNTDETKAISQFLTDIKEHGGTFIQDVKNLIEFDNQTAGFKDTDAANAKVATQVEKYKFLFESESATEAIFSAIVSQVNSANFDVLDFKYETDPNEPNGNINFKEQTNKRIDALNTFVTTHNIVASELPLAARKALFDRLTAGLSAWEKTPFVSQLNNAIGEVKTQQDLIKQLNDSLSSYRTKLGQANNQQEDLVKFIKQYAGFDSVTQTRTQSNVTINGTNPTYTFKEIANKVARVANGNDLAPVAGTTIYNAIQLEESLKQTLTNKIAEFNTATTNSNDYESNHWNHIDAQKATLESDVRAKEQAQATVQSELNTINARIAELSRRIADNERTLANQTSQLNDITNNRLPKANGDLTKAMSDLNNAQQQVQKTSTEKTDAQTKYDSSVSEVSRLQTARDNANTLLTNAQNELKTRRAELAQLEAQLKAAADADKPAIQAQIDAKKIEVQNLVDQIGDANKDGSLTKNLAQANTDLTNAIKVKDAAWNTLQAANRASQAAIDAEANARINKNTIDAIISDLNTQKQNLISSNASINSTLSADKSSLATAQANKTTKEADLATAIQNVSVAKATLNNFMNATSTITINGQSFEWGWNKADREMKDLRSKLATATQARDNAQNAFDAQHSKVEQFISETNAKVDLLKTTNDNIIEYNTRINYLLDQDSQYTFDATVDHASWTHGEETYDATSSDPAKDQRSIYFAQQKLLYLRNKQDQKQVIYDDMKAKFDALKLEVISAFKLYTIPDER